MLEEKEGDDDFERISDEDKVHVPGELHENSDDSDYEVSHYYDYYYYLRNKNVSKTKVKQFQK